MKASFLTLLTHFYLTLKRIQWGNLPREIFSHSLIYTTRHRCYSLQIMKIHQVVRYSNSYKLLNLWDIKILLHIWSGLWKYGRKKKTNVPTLVNPHVFSGWKGLLEQERWEGECGGGGRKQEEGGGIVMYLPATVTLRTCTMHVIQHQKQLNIYLHSSQSRINKVLLLLPHKW